MSGFEDLKIWQKAHQLMAEIHTIAKKLPTDEQFRIRNQIERSSASVGANIAEGYMSFYFNDKIKNMYTARKETAETQNHLRAMEIRGQISGQEAKRLIGEYHGLIKGINAFINYIRKKQTIYKTQKPS
jgi:four helix bundle protein